VARYSAIEIAVVIPIAKSVATIANEIANLRLDAAMLARGSSVIATAVAEPIPPSRAPR
jgi:hypothetical protein